MDEILRMFNLTRTRVSYADSHMNHPHVFQTGRPCLGDIEATFLDLTAKLEIAVMVNLAISYLESVNVNDSAGIGISRWPTIGKEDLPK